mmetsp:Transcript_27403/g.77814  ORF Transcript_27403/g.77814 Transcript_27403/m.77814 type:complete len:258 (+) Transcript_27403:524-1297(+)
MRSSDGAMRPARGRVGRWVGGASATSLVTGAPLWRLAASAGAAPSTPTPTTTRRAVARTARSGATSRGTTARPTGSGSGAWGTAWAQHGTRIGAAWKATPSTASRRCVLVALVAAERRRRSPRGRLAPTTAPGRDGGWTPRGMAVTLMRPCDGAHRPASRGPTSSAELPTSRSSRTTALQHWQRAAHAAVAAGAPLPLRGPSLPPGAPSCSSSTRAEARSSCSASASGAVAPRARCLRSLASQAMAEPSGPRWTSAA